MAAGGSGTPSSLSYLSVLTINSVSRDIRPVAEVPQASASPLTLVFAHLPLVDDLFLSFEDKVKESCRVLLSPGVPLHSSSLTAHLTYFTFPL